ncbi:type VII secretion protein EccB [Flindersiella endophytica]
MQTRRDRLQAYQYQVKRIMSALLGMEPEAPDQPMRRVRAAMFSGVMVGALACGVVALYGWISHSQTRGWKDQAPALIQIKESGAQFILWPDDSVEGKRVLYPVTNFTSAQLILGNSTIKDTRRTIPRVNANGVPRGGQVVGINGIPPSLPDKDASANGVWFICNHVETVKGEQKRVVDLFAGQSPIDTQYLGTDTLAVSDTSSGQLYVIYNGKRLPVESEDTLRFLDLKDNPIVKVKPAWLNSIPEGKPLEPLSVPGAGTPASKQIEGNDTVVGEVFEAGDQFFLMQTGGLAKISPTQAKLLISSGTARDPSGSQAAAKEIADASTRGIVLEDVDLSQPDHPQDLPSWAAIPNDSSDPVMCLQYSSESPQDPMQMQIGLSLKDTPRVNPVGGSLSGPPADTVSLPGGKFMVLRSYARDPGKGPLFLLTDDGLKYPVKDPSVLSLLGYDGVKIWPVPRDISDLIATGPALDPAKAKGSALAQGDPNAQPTQSVPAGN